MDETADRDADADRGRGEQRDGRVAETDDDSAGVLTRVKTVVTEAVGVVVDAVIDAV